MYHLVQRRRDQAGEAHHVRADFLGGVENALGRRHHAEVVDLEIVALQHHADDVLADVVDVALHRGEHDLASAARFAVLLRLDERHQMRHRPLHHAGALHHLRQEHLAGAEQVADRVHAVHQRPLDHVDGPRRGQPRLLGIVDDVAVDAFHQRMAQPFGDRQAAPLGVVRRGGALPGAAVALRRLEQALGGVGAAIQHRVFHRLLEVGGNLVVDGELAGVDDAHGEPGVDGVVEEDRVDGFAHAVVAAKRERDVADAAGGVNEREALLRPAHGVDEVAPVAVVFLDAGGDGEDVGVEHDVFGREAGLFHQQPVAAFDDLLAPRKGIGLAALVEGHHHRRGAVAPAQPRLFQERFLAALEADRVDDALALHAAQAGFDHVPVAGVDHHRHAGDVRLGHGEVEEAPHRRHAVRHPFVHVHVDDLGAVLHLLAGDVQRCGEVAGLHQAAELRRAGHVGALADVHEQRLVVDAQRLQAGEREAGARCRQRARLGPGSAFGQGADVFRRGAAAAADEIHPAARDEVADGLRHLLGGLVVAAEGIGQASVRMYAHESAGDLRQLLHVRTQRLGTQGAVQADDQRLGVAHGVPERFRRLPGERASAGVGDRAGDHHRQALAVLEQFVESEQRRLGVQRVEHRLDHDEVRAAVDQPARRFPVRDDEFLEGDVAGARIAHVRGNARRAVGGAEHAGHPARASGAGRGIRRPSGDGGGGEVQFLGQVFQPVVGLGDARGGEGVGLDDVRAGVEIGAMDCLHDVRARQRQHIAVALQRRVVAGEALAAVVRLLQAVGLLHGADRAVEHQHALGERLGQGMVRIERQAYSSGVAATARESTRPARRRLGDSRQLQVERRSLSAGLAYDE